MRFVIRPAARKDILQQYHYYLIEKEVEDVAERFLQSVQTSIEQIGLHP